jgi:trans-aconitate methyltransferase
MADRAEAAAHWDAAYARGDGTRSWFEKHPDMSLRMLDSAGVSATDALIDVGGGASPLTAALLDRGFGDLTVLDISAAGMQHARDRLGSRADQVHWLTADVLSWRPQRHYRAWHDRATYHFLTIDEYRQQYLHTLGTATAPGAVAVFGCFAPDGPRHCSGLPVARYSPAQLARQIGTQWLLISQDREEHITPAGTIQPFTWIALRRQSRIG